jgi:hypothetical protein
MRVVNSLLKLEEAWVEKLSKIKKLSDTMKAHFVTKSFADCREHIACILVQILTLYQDAYFIRKFPTTILNEENYQLLVEEFKGDLEGGNYPFYNQNQNQIILFITMNFLSHTVEIGNQRSMNPKTQNAVEKIFLCVTTDLKDCFIESIK